MTGGRKLAIVLAAVLVILVVAALFTARRQSKWEFRTVSEAAAAIRRDLPKGTARNDVQAWLDQRRINRTSNVHAPEEIGLLHDVRKDAVSRSDLRMIFTFNKQNRLESFVVEELTTGRHSDERYERIRD